MLHGTLGDHFDPSGVYAEATNVATGCLTNQKKLNVDLYKLNINIYTYLLG